MRGKCAAPTCRKPGLPRTLLFWLFEEFALAEPDDPAIGSHSVWLKTLKASARNSKATLSRIAKCLNNAISKFVRRGLFRVFLPTSPNVRPCGTAKAFAL